MGADEKKDPPMEDPTAEMGVVITDTFSSPGRVLELSLHNARKRR
jgi:hypothetical protein